MWTFPRCSAASAEDRSDHDGPVGRAGRCVGSAGSRGQLFRCAPSDAMPRRGTPTVFAGIAASAFVAASPRVVASAHILASPIPAHTGLSAHRQTPLIQSAGWTMRRSSVYRARRAGGPVTKMRLRHLRAAFRHCSRSLLRGGGLSPPRGNTARGACFAAGGLQGVVPLGLALYAPATLGDSSRRGRGPGRGSRPGEPESSRGREGWELMATLWH